MLSKIFFHSVISGTYIISRSFNSFSNTPLLFSQCHVLFFFLSFSTFHSLLSFENCHFLLHQVPGSTNPPVLPIHFHVGMHVFLSAAVVQSLSRVRLFSTPWTVAHQASLSITTSQSLLKLMSIELVMPSSHLILCHPLLLLPSIFPRI